MRFIKTGSPPELRIGKRFSFFSNFGWDEFIPMHNTYQKRLYNLIQPHYGRQAGTEYE